MKQRPRLLFLFLIPLSVWISFHSNPYPDKLIWSDMEGYYVYLPATFIYGGFDHIQVRDTGYLKPFPGTTKIYTKYTCGVAMLEAPFFLAAHALGSAMGYAPDGYSLIYAYALMMAGVFYAMAGLWLLWPVVRRYFSKAASVVTLGGTLFGTNLYYYTFCQPSMSHVYGFFLFAALLWLTDRVPAQPGKRGLWIWLGLVIGCIILVRPTNAVILLYPLYKWWKETPDKKQFLRIHMPGVALAAIFALITFIPQLLYWKSVTGNWVTWSYTGESFKYWNAPKLFKVLFGAWNGWILYSPIVILPLAGIVAGLRKNITGERAQLAIMVVATYIFASWWAWWFGGAFGHRCYVEYYALLALPFAGMADKLLRSRTGATVLLIFCAACIYANIGLTNSYLHSMPWDGPNWTYVNAWKQYLRLAGM